MGRAKSKHDFHMGIFMSTSTSIIGIIIVIIIIRYQACKQVSFDCFVV